MCAKNQCVIHIHTIVYQVRVSDEFVIHTITIGHDAVDRIAVCVSHSCVITCIVSSSYVKFVFQVFV